MAWRRYSNVRVRIFENDGGVARRLQEPVGLSRIRLLPCRRVMVEGGDDWHSLAQKFYGDESKWAVLFYANNFLDPTEDIAGAFIWVPDPRVVASF